MVDVASQGRFAFTPAVESSGTADDGVVMVDAGTSLPPGTTQGEMITHSLAAADPYVDYSVFDVLDTAGNPKPGGDGRIGPRELVVQVLRETACPGPNSEFPGCIENGGVYPGTAVAPRDGVTFDVSPALTTNTTNALTHLHEIFHSTFRINQDYQPGNLDVSGATIFGDDVRIEAWWLPSAWTRFRLGWVEPEAVTTDGRYRLEPGEAIAVQDSVHPSRYVLIEARYPERVAQDAWADAGVAIWASEDDHQGTAGWQRLVTAPGGAPTRVGGEPPVALTWSDGVRASFTLEDVRRESDGTWSVHVRRRRPTSLAAQPVLLVRRSLLGLPVALGGVEATLTSEGAPVVGGSVRFVAGSHVVCVATTDGRGIAGCGLGVEDLLPVVLAGGYTAQSAATDDLDPSASRAGLL